MDLTQFYLASCLLLLGPYILLCLVLKHPSACFFPWCERPSFTPLHIW